MSNSDKMDSEALASAKRYMGAFAWPTVVFGLLVVSSYATVLILSFAGQLALWLALPLVTVLTYLAYTVLHEAAHGTISGSHQSLRWLNEALGYLAAWIMMIPLTAHRHEHLAHHRHTNDGDADPDFHVGAMRNSLAAAAVAAAKLSVGQYTYYLKHRWAKAPRKQNLYLCAEVAVIMLPRLGLLAGGYWLESIVLFGAAWLLGVSVTLYLFAYLVHRPHTDVGRYVDTSTVIAPAPLHGLVSWLWVFQNYHSIHHLFPRVPFYQYARLFDEIEPIMREKGAPVYRLTLAGLSAESPACGRTRPAGETADPAAIPAGIAPSAPR